MGTTIDITTIANAVIALAAAIITTFIIPWIKSKTTENQRRDFLEWAKIAANAAEQIYKGPGRGAIKKRYVLNFLKNKGFSVDEKSVEAALEAAVKEISNVQALAILEVDNDESSKKSDDGEA